MPRTVSSPGPKSHGFYGRRGFQEAQAYNLKRVMNIMGIGPLMAAMSAAWALVGVHLRSYPAELPPGTANPGP